MYSYLNISSRNVAILSNGPNVRTNVVYLFLSDNKGSVPIQLTISFSQLEASSATGINAMKMALI